MSECMRDIFQEEILNIFIALSIIQLGSLLIALAIQLIYPYFSNYVTTSQDVSLVTKVSVSNKEEIRKLFIISGMKTSDFTMALWKDSSFKNPSLNSSDNLNYFGEICHVSSEELAYINSKTTVIRNINNLKLGQTLKGNSCVSVVQTNITIDPNMKLDYCPKLTFSKTSEINFDTSDVSDYFELTSSDSSNMKISDGDKAISLLYEIGRIDVCEEQKLDYFNSEDGLFQPSKCNKTVQTVSNFKNKLIEKDAKDICLENKILEAAISEFEKALRPIREQIKLIKNRLSGIEGSCSKCSHLSFLNTAQIHNNCSAEYNANCNNKIHSSSLSSVMGQDSEDDTSKLKLNTGKISNNNIVPLTINKYKKLQLQRNYSDNESGLKTIDVAEKRSSLAAMYIKLSERNLSLYRTAFGKKIIPKNCSNEHNSNLTKDIDLSLSRTSCIQNKNILGDRDMLPITSEPETFMVHCTPVLKIG